ncbi:hypothetical protein PCIT_b1148 [Pseudoalteromonas citrea]|uniref:PatG C-terminal domain-containing protein n=2 Tax=Pseudoalteromonas citrea TaxID=43655 RepID=A0AAD4AFH9_9GAMM|nr:hypothetical protein [Pseudoalteromonas citrea]KAF7765021.1 hypothetical protein PCIT_b1148 [Pseudoalteromonas citrea]
MSDKDADEATESHIEQQNTAFDLDTDKINTKTSEAINITAQATPIVQTSETDNETIENLEPIIQRRHSDLIYALGTIKVRFPNKGIKKQFLSAARTLGVNEQDYYGVFTNNNANTDRDKYLYLAEQVQWVLSIKAHYQYSLVPATQQILASFIASLKAPSDTLESVYSCVIGTSYVSENNLNLPEVVCEQVYSQTLDELHRTIKEVSSAQTTAIQDVIKELEVTPNMGVTPFDRARNFVAFRYPDMYEHTHKMQTGSNTIQSASLLRIDMTMFDSVSSHSIVDITFVYQENSSDKLHYYYCRIDVTGLFPFINTAIQAFTPVQPLL